MNNSNHINDRVRQFILTNFSAARELSNLDDDTSLIDGGIIDSMGILELVNFIENEFGIAIQLPDELNGLIDKVIEIKLKREVRNE